MQPFLSIRRVGGIRMKTIKKDRNTPVKTRLNTILAADRMQCGAGLLKDMAEDMENLLTQYVNVEQEQIRIRVVQQEQGQGLLIYVPVKNWENTVC